MKEEPFFFDVQLNRGPAGTTINDERANEFRRYLERKHAQKEPEEVELVDFEGPEGAEEPEAETLRLSKPVVDEPEEELPMTRFEKVVIHTFTAGAVLYFVALIAFFIWIVLQGLGPGIWDRY
jgi:hypothetical protein